MTLHVHGIVTAGHPLAADSPLRLVVWQDLAAAVTSVPPGRKVTADSLPHLEMLCALVRDGPVVPLRLGTLADDEDAVRTDVLRAGASRLRAQLHRLAGVVEVHVYVRSSWGVGSLASLAEDTAVLPSDHASHRRAYLISREYLSVARAAVAEMDAATFVGPLPAFSFLDTESRWGW